MSIKSDIYALRESLNEMSRLLDHMENDIGLKDDLPAVFPATGVIESMFGYDPDKLTTPGVNGPPHAKQKSYGNEPWVVTHRRAHLLMPRIRYLLYREHSQDYLVLEPYLETKDAAEINTLLSGMTPSSAARMLVQKAYDQYINTNSNCLVLLISLVPTDIRSYWPYLQRQLNAFEYKELPPWQQTLYYADANIENGKWVLRDAHEAWARE